MRWIELSIVFGGPVAQQWFWDWRLYSSFAVRNFLRQMRARTTTEAGIAVRSQLTSGLNAVLYLYSSLCLDLFFEPEVMV